MRLVRKYTCDSFWSGTIYSSKAYLKPNKFLYIYTYIPTRFVLKGFQPSERFISTTEARCNFSGMGDNEVVANK